MEKSLLWIEDHPGDITQALAAIRAAGVRVVLTPDPIAPLRALRLVDAESAIWERHATEGTRLEAGRIAAELEGTDFVGVILDNNLSGNRISNLFPSFRDTAGDRIAGEYLSPAGVPFVRHTTCYPTDPTDRVGLGYVNKGEEDAGIKLLALFLPRWRR